MCILPALYLARTLPCCSLLYCKTFPAFGLHSLSLALICSFPPYYQKFPNTKQHVFHLAHHSSADHLRNNTRSQTCNIQNHGWSDWPLHVYLPLSPPLPPYGDSPNHCSPLRVAHGSKQHHPLPSCSHSTPRLFFPSHPTTELSENPVSVPSTI